MAGGPRPAILTGGLVVGRLAMRKVEGGGQRGYGICRTWGRAQSGMRIQHSGGGARPKAAGVAKVTTALAALGAGPKAGSSACAEVVWQC